MFPSNHVKFGWFLLKCSLLEEVTFKFFYTRKTLEYTVNLVKAHYGVLLVQIKQLFVIFDLIEFVLFQQASSSETRLLASGL